MPVTERSWTVPAKPSGKFRNGRAIDRGARFPEPYLFRGIRLSDLTQSLARLCGDSAGEPDCPFLRPRIQAENGGPAQRASDFLRPPSLEN